MSITCVFCNKPIERDCVKLTIEYIVSTYGYNDKGQRVKYPNSINKIREAIENDFNNVVKPQYKKIITANRNKEIEEYGGYCSITPEYGTTQYCHDTCYLPVLPGVWKDVPCKIGYEYVIEHAVLKETKAWFSDKIERKYITKLMKAISYIYVPLSILFKYKYKCHMTDEELESNLPPKYEEAIDEPPAYMDDNSKEMKLVDKAWPITNYPKAI